MFSVLGQVCDFQPISSSQILVPEAQTSSVYVSNNYKISPSKQRGDQTLCQQGAKSLVYQDSSPSKSHPQILPQTQQILVRSSDDRSSTPKNDEVILGCFLVFLVF